MLQLQNATISGGGTPLLTDINLTLSGTDRRHIALLGDNGTGKSSLLNTLLGTNDVLSGTRSLHNEVLAVVPQHIEIPKNMLIGEFLQSQLEEDWMEYRIDMVLDEVNLPEDVLIQEGHELSGGQQMRVWIAAQLLKEPTIILLDEPTNHLDIDGQQWLGDFVKNFQGSTITITHDRHFINTFLNEIWQVIPWEQSLEMYKGSYDRYLEWKQEQFENDMANFERQEKQKAALRKWLRINEFHPKYQFSSIVMAKKRRLAILERFSDPKPESGKVIRFLPLEGFSKNSRLLHVSVDHKTFGEKVILQGVEVNVRPKERILISGSNGAGKTTLLNIMAGEDIHFSGVREVQNGVRLGVLGQHATLPREKKVFDAFTEATKGCGLSTTDTYRVLKSFGLDHDDTKHAVGNFSGGEQRKLEWAIMLCHKPHVLLLDEPTNHMDIATRELIESFVAKQDVAMVIISHDQYFVDKVDVTSHIVLG